MLQSKVILYPKSAEISYKVALLKYVYFIEKNINNVLLPILKNMPDTFNKDNLYEIRCDDFLEELEIAFQEIRDLIAPYRGLLIGDLPVRFAKLVGFTTKEIIASMQGIITVTYGNQQPGVINTTPVDLGVNIFNNSLRPSLKELVRASTLTNSKLIKSIETNLLDQVAIIIEQGYTSGTSAKVLAKQIKERFGVTENRAKLIARDQIGKIHSDVVRDENLNLGLDKYIWFTSGDERVRTSHKVMNMKICSWYDPTIYKDSIEDKEWKKRSSIGGVELHPGQDYQCRCNEKAIFE